MKLRKTLKKHFIHSVCLSIFPLKIFTSFLSTGMMISIPFLLTTFCIYGFFSELRNLHGKSLMCFVLGLLIMYTFLIIIQFQADSFALESIACVFCGYMIYTGVLLSFFWMNVMCYDIWSTFRYLKLLQN